MRKEAAVLRKQQEGLRPDRRFLWRARSERLETASSRELALLKEA